MIKARVLLAGMTLAGAAAAHAGVTVTPTAVSDYDFRGISQTAAGPALQASVDYAVSGFHFDAWGSNIEWGPSYKGSMELDLQGDYTFGSDDTAKVTIGVVDYTYPSMSDQNTVEPWVTVAKKWLSFSAHYSSDWFNLGNAWYTELNAAVPIGSSGYTVAGHVGRSTGDAWKSIEYTDWSAGVTKGFGNFTVGLKYVTSDAPEFTAAQSLAAYGKKNVFETRDRVILSVSTTLPWAKP